MENSSVWVPENIKERPLAKTGRTDNDDDQDGKKKGRWGGGGSVIMGGKTGLPQEEKRLWRQICWECGGKFALLCLVAALYFSFWCYRRTEHQVVLLVYLLSFVLVKQKKRKTGEPGENRPKKGKANEIWKMKDHKMHCCLSRTSLNYRPGRDFQAGSSSSLHYFAVLTMGMITFPGACSVHVLRMTLIFVQAISHG